MAQVWKYTLQPQHTTVTMTTGAKILCAHKQGEETICIWAEVDPSLQQTEPRQIEVFGTGHSMPEADRRYIGTAFLYHESLVFHVYERIS